MFRSSSSSQQSYVTESLCNKLKLKAAKVKAQNPHTQYIGRESVQGSDHYWAIIINESIRADSGLVAVNNKFDWVISGPTSDSSSSGDNVASHLCISGAPPSIESNDEIVNALRRFLETDSVGISNDHDVHQEKPTESEIVKSVFNDEDNRYEVSLP